MKSDKVKVKVSVRTNMAGSKCEDIVEFDRNVWDYMSEQERDEIILMSLHTMFEWDYEIIS